MYGTVRIGPDVCLFYRYTHEPNISKGNNRYRNGDIEIVSGKARRWDKNRNINID